MSNLQDLLAQKAALERQIQDAQRAAKSDAVARVNQIIAENGLSLQDLSFGGVKPKKASAGGKVAAKYRDPASGATWTGRGLKPKWLQSALASGKSLDDFKI